MKYVILTIKYIDFESIYNPINLYIFSSFMIFNAFNYIFSSMFCYFKSIKSFSFFKKRKRKLEKYFCHNEGKSRWPIFCALPFCLFLFIHFLK